MIKGIFFDFDGTLCDLVECHFDSLNYSILEICGEKSVISHEEQIKIFNGLSTLKKLNILLKMGRISKIDIDNISILKQKKTLDYIEKYIIANNELRINLIKLKNDGYKLYCVSNALLDTVNLGLKKMNIYDVFDKVVGNNFTKRQKPSPDIYLQSFIDAELDPKECLVVEDSKHGRESAIRSGAHLYTVKNNKGIIYDNIDNFIKKCNIKKNKVKWTDSTLNVIVPMAGQGKRFKDKGFTLPKPLIDINGKPMIQTVIDNLNIDANFIFIVQKEHYEKYNLGTYLEMMVPGCTIVQTDGLTEGAACTALLAKDFINNDSQLLIANSDQFVVWDSCDFMYSMICSDVDGGILTFKANDPKWSYAKCNEDGLVTEVAEKQVISNDATVGIYWWANGSDFVKYAEQMIQKDIRFRNEYYICPVYNQAIEDNKKVKIYHIEEMWGIGTPEDRQYFLDNYKND